MDKQAIQFEKDKLETWGDRTGPDAEEQARALHALRVLCACSARALRVLSARALCACPRVLCASASSLRVLYLYPLRMHSTRTMHCT